MCREIAPALIVGLCKECDEKSTPDDRYEIRYIIESMATVRWLRIPLAIMILVFMAACGTLENVPDDFKYGQYERQYAVSMGESLTKLVEGGWNPGRQAALETRLDELGLDNEMQFIDWWLYSQQNVLVEISGQTDKIVYLVAHYDKIDAFPFGVINQITNGILDPVFSALSLSQGALDNGTGVVTLIELAKWMQTCVEDSAAGKRCWVPKKTYRFLFTGGEELGLKGSRAAVAAMAGDDWENIEYIINVDGVGQKGDDTGLAVMTNSDELLNDAGLSAFQMMRFFDRKFDFARGYYLPLTTSDHTSFQGHNTLIDMIMGFLFGAWGGLLPQRSWFAPYLLRYKSEVISFSSGGVTTDWAIIFSMLGLPFGPIHGFRDTLDKIDVTKLFEAFLVIRRLIVLRDHK